MNNPRTVLACIGALFIAFAAHGQGGLQDKVSQAQMLQAQGIITITPDQIDSLKRSRMRTQTPESLEEKDEMEKAVLDSLYQGPIQQDSLLLDSLRYGLDSLPKRYSQRIFARSPGPLFGSYMSSVGKSHILGAGDEITLSLWGDKEKQYQLLLNAAGQIFLEGIGLISVNGLTIADAEKKLREKLSEIYSGILNNTTHVEVSQARPGPIKIFVLGEVMLPGGYIFSGNTSILSALYQAKGPTDIGTVRNIKLSRGSTHFYLDIYEYLLKGNPTSPDHLQDGDILFSGRAEILVEIDGDIGRPAIYELKKNEGVKEILEFAGMINPTAAHHRISLKRLSDSGKVEYIDLASPQDFISGKESYKLKDGDYLYVEKSSEEADNFVTVTGPVFYEGTYTLEGVKTISDLIKKAGGLREDAYLGRVHVLRFQPDGSSELFSYSIENTNLESIPLKPKDNIILYSQKDMFAPDSVEIAGAILMPGKYLYSKGMTIKGLILRAGGFLPNYEPGKALCFRPRVKDRKVEAQEVTLSGGLEESEQRFILSPRDFILIPEDPDWYNKEIVILSGQFKYPGKYALTHPGEKLISVISRAGGLKENAYTPGFRFFRKQNKVGRIGIDLEQAMKSPDDVINVPMLDKDSIYIPEKQMTVKVVGEVGFPTSVLYKKGKSVDYYISRAGGYARLGDKKRVILEYGNGETTGEGDFYRDPDPGSVIFVPSMPEPIPIDWFKGINAVVGTMAAAAALVLSILAISNKL